MHKEWSGLVIKADDPWWQDHFPPTGWGCQCRAHAVDEDYLRQQGKTGPDEAPKDGTYDWQDPVSKRVFRNIPNGVDPGWDYAPGASLDLKEFIADKAAKLPGQIAEQFVAAMASAAVGAILDNMAVDAYQRALIPGGPHHGWLLQQQKLSTTKLRKSIRSLEKQIALHIAWIANPYLKFTADNSDPNDVKYQQEWKWPSDIARLRQLIEIIEGVIRERDNEA